MIKNKAWIHSKNIDGMITPFEVENVNKDVISYGLGQSGYDIKIDSEVKIFNSGAKVIDPKKFRDCLTKALEVIYDYDSKEYYIILPAHSFALAKSVEYIKLPSNIKAFLHCKSTYARCGLHINNTVIQAGFQGNIVLELSNNTDFDIKVYIFEGLGELSFIEIENGTDGYNGVYQGQSSVLGSEIKR